MSTIASLPIQHLLAEENADTFDSFVLWFHNALVQYLEANMQLENLQKLLV